jgi:PPOX class probable F420-dependent enzyme
VNRKVRRTTFTAREREMLDDARVARLATVRPDGRPHLVPVTFASPEPGLIVTAVDHKPKRTTNLQRLRNVEAHPAVSLLVDHYEGDWTALWWLRIDATARVVLEEPYRTTLTGALVRKYAQYVARPPTGAVIAMKIDAITSWNLD